MTGSQFAGLEHSWNGAPSVTQKREIYILMAGGEVKMHSVRKFAFPFCSLNEKLAVIGTCATWTILIKNQIHTHTPSHGQPFYVPAIAPNTHTYTLPWNGSQPQKPYTLSSPAPLSTETVPPMVFDATLDFGRLQVRPQTLYIWAIFACWTMPFIFHIHTHIKCGAQELVWSGMAAGCGVCVTIIFCIKLFVGHLTACLKCCGNSGVDNLTVPYAYWPSGPHSPPHLWVIVIIVAHIIREWF